MIIASATIVIVENAQYHVYFRQYLLDHHGIE